MSSIAFAKAELRVAMARGVRQCVLIGSRLHFNEHPDLQVFALDENPSSDAPNHIVPTQFDSESLAAALQKSNFDKVKATLFVWFGAGYRNTDAVLASLAFVASLPAGSGVLLDYAVERTALSSLTHTALDALASRICQVGGGVKYLIQPQAVAAMLRGLGFRRIHDLSLQESSVGTSRLVSAFV
jgi:O-methyltransferase involved in polyketide biosynthesis